MNDINKWVVLQDPNGGRGLYLWRESTYDKKPNIGFYYNRISAEEMCKKLNSTEHGKSKV